MPGGQRLALHAARRAPGFGGWFLGRLAVLARRWPGLFVRLAASELPGIDRAALAQPVARDAFLAGYTEAFRRGSAGVAQDLRVLTRPWGFDLGSITIPASIHHGDADATVPPSHVRLYAKAIPGAQLHRYPGHGHFSILGAAAQLLAAPGQCATAGSQAAGATRTSFRQQGQERSQLALPAGPGSPPGQSRAPARAGGYRRLSGARQPDATTHAT